MVVVPAATGSPGSTACAAGEIRVRVVLDFGGAAGAPSGVSDVCVPVADRTTGAELLVARARQLGTPAPRFEGGFVCAIDGFPETGCGEQTGAGYRYWSYWHGEAGSWTYANVGPAGWKLRDGDVEGWRFLDGGPESTAAPPRAAPTSCPAPAPAPAPTRSPAPTAPPTTAPAAVPPSPASSTTTATPAPTSTTTTPAAIDAGGARGRETIDVAARPAADSGEDDGGGPPVALLAVTAAIVALAVAAALRFRAGRGT